MGVMEAPGFGSQTASYGYWEVSMTQLRVAHLREQGQDMILVPLADSFGNRSEAQQSQEVAEIQARARAAGLTGTVAVFWRGGFRGPRPWHPFLRSIGYHGVLTNLNKAISW